MKHYLNISDIDHLPTWVDEAIQLKKDPRAQQHLGQGKTLGLFFFNSSLRTRLSTQKAAKNLGMEVMVMNFGTDGWQLEYEDGAVMDQGCAEHIKEAAQVVSQYCDIMAVRSFAQLQDRDADTAEKVLNGFKKYASIPIVNMESATAHPLQALADAITLEEHRTVKKPKVVLSWAPHPRALPHAVANSFVQMMKAQTEMDFVITHPEGYALDPNLTADCVIVTDQEKALADADFVYVKNWSSYEKYGQVLKGHEHWTITPEKLGKAQFMHCLPIRRNVVATDGVLDGDQSLVIAQADNRTFAAQLVLQKILKTL
jgi:N-succinyl-L-ornithine transcarbamylase